MMENHFVRPFSSFARIILVVLFLSTLLLTSRLAYSEMDNSADHGDHEVGTLANELFMSASMASSSPNVEFAGQIGGAIPGVAIEGSYAYLGVGPRLKIFDITNPATLNLVGQTIPLRATIKDIAIAGNYAYATAGFQGLLIINIADPANPVEVGTYDTVGYANGVAVDGNYAYVASGNDGLRIFNVTNPAVPTLVSVINTPGLAFDVALAGNFAFVADGDSGLRMIDITNPATPFEASFYDTPGLAYHVTLSGANAYVADGGSGLHIIDVTDPTAPSMTGQIETPGTATGVAVGGNTAYVADNYGGLRIIDITEPAFSAELGSFTDCEAWSVAMAGSYAYIGDDYGGFWIIDTTDPTAPTEAFYYPSTGTANDLFVTDNHAYVAAGSNGLFIIDITDPTALSYSSTFEAAGTGVDVLVSGNYAYFIGSSALQIVDVSNPANPITTAIEDTPGYANGIALQGDYAFVADGTEGGLRVINIANPYAPSETGFIDTPGGAWDVVVDGKYAYVADGLDGGLRVINVANPYAPSETGFIDTQDQALDVVVVGSTAYVGTPNRGLLVIDVSTPTAPYELGSFYPHWGAWGVALSGNLAFVSGGQGGLHIVDVSDPADLSEVGFHDTPGSAGGLTVLGKYVYVADAHGGLIIFALKSIMEAGPDQIDLVGNPGDILSATLTVSEVGALRDIEGIEFVATDLKNEDGDVVPGESITYSPEISELAASESQSVTVSIPLAGNLSAGIYNGSITINTLDAGAKSIPISVKILSYITISKKASPAGTTSFDFDGGFGIFTLQNGESKNFYSLVPGDYLVREKDLTGWSLGQIDCSSEHVTREKDRVTIHLAEREDVNCTFINERLSVTADAGGPYSGYEGSPVSLDASGSTNKEIIKLYKWDCTADGSFDIYTKEPTGHSCTYEDDGVYSLRLLTVDIFDQQTDDKAQVTVENVAPDVDAGKDQTVNAGVAVLFAASIYDPGSADTHSIEWDFGDGSQAADTLTPTHVYNHTGKYVVVLTVTDDDGASASDELKVNVLNSLPTLSNLSIHPAEIYEGGICKVSGRASDTGGDGGLRLEIAWGDGEVLTEDFKTSSADFSFDHVYVDDQPSGTPADSYVINLKVSDEEGGFSTKTLVIQVNNVEPTVSVGPDKRIELGEAAYFSATIVDPGVSDTYTVNWDFGDGSAYGKGINVTHVFTKPGVYTTVVTVEDDDGGVGEDRLKVTVVEDVKYNSLFPVIMRP